MEKFACDKCKNEIKAQEYRSNVLTIYRKEEKPNHTVFHLCKGCMQIILFSILGMKKG